VTPDLQQKIAAVIEEAKDALAEHERLIGELRQWLSAPLPEDQRSRVEGLLERALAMKARTSVRLNHLASVVMSTHALAEHERRKDPPS
jgi:hypothetical protein